MRGLCPLVEWWLLRAALQGCGYPQCLLLSRLQAEKLKPERLGAVQGWPRSGSALASLRTAAGRLLSSPAALFLVLVLLTRLWQPNRSSWVPALRSRKGTRSSGCGSQRR